MNRATISPKPSSGTPLPAPRLLVELEPWWRVFLGNLGDALRQREAAPVSLSVPSAPFWPDVFVNTRVPARAIAQSVLYHAFVLVALWGFSQAWVKRARMQLNSPFKNQTITYYDVSEYLPPLNSGSAPAREARKGEPEYARQPIISIPPIPDNSTQTIVDPIHPPTLKHEVKLPNIVISTNIPAPPAATATRGPAQLYVPTDVVAPAPENVRRNLADLRIPKLPEPAVVEPPPEPGQRNIGELNIASLEPAIAEPALPVPAQRASTAGSEGAENVAPPPAISSGGSHAEAAGQFIALSVRPAPPSGPIELPGGNRRGIFAATPEGKPGAAGTPDIAGGGTGPGGTGSGSGGPGSGAGAGNPAGVYVGGGPGPAGPVAGPAGASPSPGVGGGPAKGDGLLKSLIAAARPTLPADVPRDADPGSAIDRPHRDSAPIEDEVFGPKKYYKMTINMPNLTSAGGSWILRFAELKQNAAPGELIAPVATHKVDPAFPPALMKMGIEGTVTLYAIIRADGSVGEVRVLRGLDERLDESAKTALARWIFRPGTKNGSAVDLEAVVNIPFIPAKRVRY